MLVGAQRHSRFIAVRWHEEHNVPQRYIKLGQKLDHGIEIPEVPPRHDSVHLHRQLHFVTSSDDVERPPVQT